MILYDDENSLNNQDNCGGCEDGYNMGDNGFYLEPLFALTPKEHEYNHPLADELSINDDFSLKQEEGTLEEVVDRYIQNNSTSTNTSSSTEKKSEQEKSKRFFQSQKNQKKK